VCDRLYCAIEPYKEKSYSSFTMNSFHVYIVLIAVLNLYHGTLCKVDFYNFLDPGGSHTGMLPFIDTTMILKNFLKSNKNAHNFYVAL
jgi:hypothetical protein